MRIRVIVAAAVVGALLLPSLPALAGEAAEPVLAERSAPSTHRAGSLDQEAIFRILCGGLVVRDDSLHTRLWTLAGRLASRGWTPPRVTVRVVVSEPGVR